MRVCGIGFSRHPAAGNYQWPMARLTALIVLNCVLVGFIFWSMDREEISPHFPVVVYGIIALPTLGFLWTTRDRKLKR